jgi:hypothetical protein
MAAITVTITITITVTIAITITVTIAVAVPVSIPVAVTIFLQQLHGPFNNATIAPPAFARVAMVCCRARLQNGGGANTGSGYAAVAIVA